MDMSFLLKSGTECSVELKNINEHMEIAGFICYTPAGRCRK